MYHSPVTIRFGYFVSRYVTCTYILVCIVLYICMYIESELIEIGMRRKLA